MENNKLRRIINQNYGFTLKNLILDIYTGVNGSKILVNRAEGEILKQKHYGVQSVRPLPIRVLLENQLKRI